MITDGTPGGGWRGWRWVLRLRERLCARQGHRVTGYVAPAVVETPEGPFRLMGRCACGRVHDGQFLTPAEAARYERLKRIDVLQPDVGPLDFARTRLP